jgi:hypothetical protein
MILISQAPLFDLITRAEKWLKENTYTIPVIKWDTEAWVRIQPTLEGSEQLERPHHPTAGGRELPLRVNRYGQ